MPTSNHHKKQGQEPAANIHAKANANKAIVDPNDLDILCGSGKVETEHPGNQRFRVIVSKHYAEYAVAKTKREKMMTTQRIMNDLFSLGPIRFLSKDPILGTFRLAKRRAGRNKVAHCLREIKLAKAQLGFKRTCIFRNPQDCSDDQTVALFASLLMQQQDTVLQDAHSRLLRSARLQRTASETAQPTLETYDDITPISIGQERSSSYQEQDDSVLTADLQRLCILENGGPPLAEHP